MAKAKQLIDIYEHDSGLFDARGDIAPGREHYYYTKGAYELAANNTAEAEALFRKAIRYGYASDGYSGLLEIYRRKGNIDSVAHFSYQYEAAQDSLHHAMQIDAIHRYAALYNYSHSENVDLRGEDCRFFYHGKEGLRGEVYKISLYLFAYRRVIFKVACVEVYDLDCEETAISLLYHKVIQLYVRMDHMVLCQLSKAVGKDLHEDEFVVHVDTAQLVGVHRSF